MFDQLAEYMEFHIEARYPDEKRDFYQKCSEEFTTNKVNEMYEVYQWLKKKIKRIIRKFADILVKKGIRIEQVILYGSYVSGNINPYSDIDIAVISPDFGNDKFEESKLLLQTAWRVDPRLQPVLISSESFDKNTWIPLVHQIKEYGIEIKAA